MIFGWDLPPNLSLVMVGFVPVLILLIKNNWDTARVRRDTKTSNGKTLGERVEQLDRRLNQFMVIENTRHKQNTSRLARIEDELIITDRRNNDDG